MSLVEREDMRMSQVPVPADKRPNRWRMIVMILIPAVVVVGVMGFLTADGFRASRDGRPPIQVPGEAGSWSLQSSGSPTAIQLLEWMGTACIIGLFVIGVFLVIPILTLRAACAICRIPEPDLRRGATICLAALGASLAANLCIWATVYFLWGPSGPFSVKDTQSDRLIVAPERIAEAERRADLEYNMAWMFGGAITSVVASAAVYGRSLKGRLSYSAAPEPIGMGDGLWVAVIQVLIQAAIGGGILFALRGLTENPF